MQDWCRDLLWHKVSRVSVGLQSERWSKHNTTLDRRLYRDWFWGTLSAGCKLLCYPGAFNMRTGPVHWKLLVRSTYVNSFALKSIPLHPLSLSLSLSPLPPPSLTPPLSLSFSLSHTFPFSRHYFPCSLRALSNQIYFAAVSPARSKSAGYVSWAHSMLADPWWVEA